MVIDDVCDVEGVVVADVVAELEMLVVWVVLKLVVLVVVCDLDAEVVALDVGEVDRVVVGVVVAVDVGVAVGVVEPVADIDVVSVDVIEEV